MQRCDSFENEKGTLISTNYRSDVGKGKRSGHRHCRTDTRKDQDNESRRPEKRSPSTESSALIDSVRSKVLRSSSSHFSLVVDERKPKRGPLEFYRKFKRGMRYKKLSLY